MSWRRAWLDGTGGEGVSCKEMRRLRGWRDRARTVSSRATGLPAEPQFCVSWRPSLTKNSPSDTNLFSYRHLVLVESSWKRMEHEESGNGGLAGVPSANSTAPR